MRPEVKCTIQYGVLAGFLFLLPAVFYDELKFFFPVGSDRMFITVMASAIILFVIVHAYFTSKRYRNLENDLKGRYKKVFEKLPNSVWVLSSNKHEILAANEMAMRYYGPYAGESESFNFFSLFQEPGKVRLENGTKPFTIRNLVMVDRFYDPRHVDLFVMPVVYDAENGVMVLAVDHSEVHKSLQENLKLNESLKEQNEWLKNVSFLHSHHVRSHLANILGIINLTEDKEYLSSEVLEMLRKSAKSLDKEIKNVNEILMEKKNLKADSDFDEPHSKVIIFVDDDKIQHMINKRILLKINPNLELVFFENPYDALSWLEKNVADILLLDINMPEMEGWDFLDLMKDRGINMEVKMLTSSLDPKDIEKSHKFEMVSGFLVKPLRKEVIDEFL